MKKILFAANLDARSDRALDRALMLSATHSAELLILHVTESAVRPENDAALAEMKRSIQQSDAITAAAKAYVKTKIAYGTPVREIVAEAIAFEADLVIMGLGRDFSMGRLVGGNIVEKVIAETDLPMLIVKERPNSVYKNCVVAFDESTGARLALETVFGLAPGAMVTVVNAVEEENPEGRTIANKEDLVQGYTRQIAMEFSKTENRKQNELQVLVDAGAAADVVLKRAAELGSDLVSFGRTSKTGLARIILGSTAQVLLEHLKCDALVAGIRRNMGN